MKKSKFISFLLAIAMLFGVAVMPFSAVSAVDLDDYNLTTVQKYFYRVIGSLARADYYETDVLASITLAQAIYEGGWGRYSLPVGGCNLFGIKAYKTWGGMVYDQKTSMLYSSYDDYLFSEGQGHLNTYSAWRAHINWAESVSVHSSLFLNESKYAAVVGEKDYKVAAREIVEAGYCNDYGYIETVISLIEQYDMTEYDDLTPDEDGVVAVVTKQERKLLDIGETYQIPLTYYPADKTASSLTWKSDNESVATVDENGLVTARSHGMTLVTASLANGREAACIIYVDCNATIIDKDVTIYKNPTTASSDNGKIYRGMAVKALEGSLVKGTDGNYFYKVSGVGSKNTIIEGYALAANIYLNKRNVSSIAIVSDDITLKRGDDYKVKAVVAPADAVDTELKWLSSDKSIATVDENGVITAKANGVCVITAKAEGGCERNIKVTVADAYREYDALVSAYETLTVRSEPNADSSRVGTMSFLSSVKILGEAEGEFYKITGSSTAGKVITGYANSAYIQKLVEGGSVSYGTVSAETTVYSEPTIDSITYGKLKAGGEYAILDHDEATGFSYIVGIKTTNEAVHGYVNVDLESGSSSSPDNNSGISVPSGSYYGRTTSDLHIRAGAGSGYESLGKFSSGEQIIITGEAVNGWYPVIGKNSSGSAVSGYSSADYITLLYSGSVNATKLNVRAEPVSGEVVATVVNGQKLIIVGEVSDGWYKIETEDGAVSGYCSADYVINNGLISVPATENPPVNPPQQSDDFKILDSNLKIASGVLYGVKLDTTVATLLTKLQGEITIVDAKGKALSSDDLVGTGAVIRVTQNGQTQDAATVLVMGDVDGDGTVTTYDYVYVKRDFLGTYTLSGLYLKAGLVSGESDLTVIDYIYIKRHFFGTYKIG